MGLTTEFIGSARAASGPGASPYLAYDTFTRDNSSTLGNTEAVDGDGLTVTQRTWTERAGDWTISSDALLGPAGFSGHIATFDIEVSDFTADATLRYSTDGSGQGPGIIFRTDGTIGDSFYAWLDLGDNQFQIWENNSSLRGESTPTLVADTDYAVQVVCAGSSIACTIDGGNTASYPSAGNTNLTHCGVMGFSAAAQNVTCKDIKVQP